MAVRSLGGLHEDLALKYDTSLNCEVGSFQNYYLFLIRQENSGKSLLNSGSFLFFFFLEWAHSGKLFQEL